MTTSQPAAHGRAVVDADLAEVWQALADAAPRQAHARSAADEMDGLEWRRARLSGVPA